jgi:hypothetical protein
MKNLLKNFSFLILLTVIVFFAAGCPDGKPPAPTGLTATVSENGKIIILSWNPVENPGQYMVYGSFKSGGPFVFIGDVRSGTAFYVTHMDDKGKIPLEPNTTYYFKVGCYDSRIGELSSEVSATTGNWEKE